MTKIRLVTAPNGELAHEREVPGYVHIPDVVLWGNRAFRFAEGDADEQTYQEVFHVQLTDGEASLSLSTGEEIAPAI